MAYKKKDKNRIMYIEENELIEIIIPEGKHLFTWRKKLNDNTALPGVIKIHWSLLKSTTHRSKLLEVKCDDCDLLFNRRIRDLDIKDNIHYCRNCRKKGERNPIFGLLKENNPNFGQIRESIKGENNPSKQNNVRDKISKSKKGKQTTSTLGKHHSTETRNKMSLGIINAYKTGKLKPGNGWTNVKIEKYKGIDYQGSYELRFLKFFDNLGKLDLIERGPIINYCINGKIHNYFIDFQIKGTNIVFEVKSNYFWKKSETINSIKKKEAEKLYNYQLIIDNNFKNINNILCKNYL